MAAATPLDRDQKWLLDCLYATLSNSHDVRSFAEASLYQASLQKGFGAALARVAVNREVPFGLRQLLYLSAVLLKQFVRQHWKEDEEGFVHPVVSPEEKASVRQLIISSLDDHHGKIRTAVGMVVASIATYDWPEEWPELLPWLLKMIGDQTNINGVNGALRCLALISTDLDDASVPKLVPVLFPYLQTIVSSPHLYEKVMREKAISIVHSCISVLGSMSGIYKKETGSLVISMLKPWMDQFCIILQSPIQCEDPDDWSMRLEVLKCLIQIIQNFASIAETEIAVIFTPLWTTFVSCVNMYQLSLIQGVQDSYSGRFDSDGAEKGLETLCIQLFEFLLTVVGSFKFAKVFEKSVKELVYYTIAFLQMTEDQVHTWLTDINQYVADEDDASYSCRVSGSLLLEEIVNVYGTDGIYSLIEAAEKHFMESGQARMMGSKYWWKVREASLFALCSVSEPLLEEEESGLARTKVVDLLHQMLAEDIGTDVNEYPFIHARTLAAVAKFSSMINRNLHEQYLLHSFQAIALDVPPPVKIGACRALSQLLQEAKIEFLQTHLMGIFSALSDLLRLASEETLHLVLETLQATVTAGAELLISVEPVLSPVMLNMWVEHISDPFISIDALEVLQAIKNSPGCLQPLVLRILPAVGPVLEQPHRQPAGLVAGSLDLLTMILKNTPIDIVNTVYNGCFNSVIQIILKSDDHGELQNATECLAAFVSGGKQELLAWGGEPGLTMKCLLDAASRLLDPTMESSGSLFVGTYILQLIFHFPSEMSSHAKELVTAIVRRMQTSEIAGLKSSLIVILARLVHLTFPNVEQFINLMLSVPANGYENSLSYVMSEWTKQQGNLYKKISFCSLLKTTPSSGEIQGAYQIKVTTTALALLLSTRHQELVKINVQGQLIKSIIGITTRSKAKSAPDQWSMVPLPLKVFSLLADTLIEIQEQVLADNDEGSDWEEVEDGHHNDHEDLLLSTALSTGARPSAEHLKAMERVFNESDDDNEFDANFVKGVDPLNEINLANYLKGFLTNFVNNDRVLFDQLFKGLNQAQRNAITMVVSS